MIFTVHDFVTSTETPLGSISDRQKWRRSSLEFFTRIITMNDSKRQTRPLSGTPQACHHQRGKPSRLSGLSSRGAHTNTRCIPN